MVAQTAGRDSLGDFAPQFAALNDDILFGQAPPIRPEEVLHVSNVTFEPGCRNNWHVHRATSGGGQLLICVDGLGWYQAKGEPARPLAPGDVVSIPANVEHWHGARADSWFSHLAIAVPGENASNEWLAPVGDEEYAAL